MRIKVLKKSNIRGIESNGMICSPLELKYSEDHEGILVLDKNEKIGSSLYSVIGDEILDFDITPNRSDCLSVIGITREIIAILNSHKFDYKINEKYLNFNTLNNFQSKKSKNIDVQNLNFEKCLRYSGSEISSIVVENSPFWIKDRLIKSGLRPINNIVDVTNYVMMELGQPLHAFDLSKIKTKKIEVKSSKNKEKFKSLDGENRELNSNIWDHIASTKEAYNIYISKEDESKGIQITYSMIFVLFSVCFIFIAVLIGFNLARRLSNPINNLIQSANKISDGNFDAKVSEADAFDEIKVLISSYNKMIFEIENKQNQLISKSLEDEEKRLFIEAILSLLTIGVISLDKEFNVILANKTTSTIFKNTKKIKEKTNFIEIFPEWEKIFFNFKKSKKILENFQYEYFLNDDLRNFPKYIKSQTENLKKYAKHADVKKELFLVLPSNTLEVIQQFTYNMGDYNVYVITKDALEPIILSLKRIQDFELVEKLNPEERDDICRIIGKFAHTTKRRIQIDQYFAEEFLDTLKKAGTQLPKEILKSVIEFEGAEMLNPPMEKRNKKILTQELIDKRIQLTKEIEIREIPEIEAKIRFKDKNKNE